MIAKSSWWPCLLVIVACPGNAGPSDEAIARYVGDDQGATTSGADAGAAPVARPKARRVALTIERAKGVPDLDTGPGHSDVYVLVSSEGQRFRTSVVSSADPVWGDSTVFDFRPGGILEVSLFDEDALSSDEKIGTQTVPLPELAEGETTTLEIAFKNGEAGTVTITVTGIGRP